LNISVALDGTVIGIDSSPNLANVWRWTGGGWLLVASPTSFRKIAAGSSQFIVAATEGGEIYRFVFTILFEGLIEL
jgi:hypothetical protein